MIVILTMERDLANGKTCHISPNTATVLLLLSLNPKDDLRKDQTIQRNIIYWFCKPLHLTQLFFTCTMHQKRAFISVMTRKKLFLEKGVITAIK